MEIKLENISVDDLEGENEFLQSKFWAIHKGQFGFENKAYRCKVDGFSFTISILLRKLPLGRYFAYIPRAPSKEVFSRLSNVIKPFLFLEKLLSQISLQLPNNVIFIRIEPVIEDYILKSDVITKYGDQESFDQKAIDSLGIGEKFHKGLDVQVPSTVLLELNGDMEELYEKMHKKTRYNIRLARKKNISVIEDNLKIEEFYRIYKETAQRDNIRIHTLNYYQSVLDCASLENVNTSLFLAYHADDLLGSIMVIYYGNRATYLYGASSDVKRNFMASYLLQDIAIRKAISLNCIEYDMFGIPQNDNPKYKMQGLYKFKTGFSKNIVHYVGAMDYVLKRVEYKAMQKAEGLRNFYYKKIRRNTK